VLGALILLFINDAIFFLGVGTFFTPMIQGVLLIAVVALAAIARNLQRSHP
jgi:ribose/xylose/arabinose/galactoside ABC-type transport system permease subunit